MKLTLGSQVIDQNQVECYSQVNWNQDNFNKTQDLFIEKKTIIKFDDPIELRNTHAKYLEEVSTIF